MSARTRSIALATLLGLLIPGLGLGQDANGKGGPGNEKPGAPPGPETERKAWSNAQVEQHLFGPDRARRSQAAFEALDRNCVSEDTWLRLLDTAFPTLEEREEAKFLAARALVRVGTEKSLKRLMQLFEEPPQVVDKDERGRPVARYGFQGEASVAYHMMATRLTYARLDARLAGLDDAAKAKALVDLLADADASYLAMKPPEALEERPFWWTQELVRRLSRTGAAGVRAWFAKLPDAQGPARVTLEEGWMGALQQRFKDAKLANDPTLNSGGWQDHGMRDHTRWSGVVRQVLGPESRSAVVEGVRGHLPRLDRPMSELDRGLVGAIAYLMLDELEPELITLAQTCEGKDLGVITLALGVFGTDRGLRCIVDRMGDTRSAPTARIVALCQAELERERETPWTGRFTYLVCLCGMNPQHAKYADPALIERTLTRVRAIFSTVKPRSREDHAKEPTLRYLETVLKNARTAHSQEQPR